MAILDKQQAADYQRRDLGEIGVPLTWVVKVIEGQATAIGQGQAGAALFPIRRVEALLAVVHQRRRETHLLADMEVALLQAFEHQRQVGVTLALVERAVTGVVNGVTRARLQIIGQCRGVATEFASLKVGTAQLEEQHHGSSQQNAHQQQVDQVFPAPFRGRSGAVMLFRVEMLRRAHGSPP